MDQTVFSTHVPPGPADTAYTTKTLARLAVAQAAADLADQTAKLVDIRDRESTVVDACQQLIARTQDLLRLALVQDYEDGKQIVRNGAPVNPFDDPEYAPLLWSWYHSIERPWKQASDSNVESTLPKGLQDPLVTAHRLDGWLARSGRTRADNEIATHLVEHDMDTEHASIERHGSFLSDSESSARTSEKNAQQIRHQRYVKRVERQARQGFVTFDELPGADERGHVVRLLWPQIQQDLIRQHPELSDELGRATLLRVRGSVAVIGQAPESLGNLYYTLTETFEESVKKVTGVHVYIRVLDAPGVLKWIEEHKERR